MTESADERKNTLGLRLLMITWGIEPLKDWPQEMPERERELWRVRGEWMDSLSRRDTKEALLEALSAKR